MLHAMEAMKTGKMGVNRAALEHGVPRTTLKDRIAGRVIHGTNIYRPQALPDSRGRERTREVSCGLFKDG